jgi:hypothetical protein
MYKQMSDMEKQYKGQLSDMERQYKSKIDGLEKQVAELHSQVSMVLNPHGYSEPFILAMSPCHGPHTGCLRMSTSAPSAIHGCDQSQQYMQLFLQYQTNRTSAVLGTKIKTSTHSSCPAQVEELEEQLTHAQQAAQEAEARAAKGGSKSRAGPTPE